MAGMSVADGRWRGRRAWTVANDVLSLTVLQGGGHLASLVLAEAPRVNPLWTPAWRTIEPWEYRSASGRRWGGSPLLASAAGHLLCLGHFGPPSLAEAQRGRDGHGEAPVARWRLLGRDVTPRHGRLRIGCDLPVAGMAVSRALTVRPGSHIVEIVTEVRSTVDRDQPYTMSEHGTVGAPFLEKGVTFFDSSAGEGRTYPSAFGAPQRLRTDAAFRWPDGPGADGGTVDLRTLGRAWRANSDFSAQHMDPAREDAWASAVNPRLGVMLAYHWRRRDFPWVGNWEENRARRAPPWHGRELARGIELANTPFPDGLEAALRRGRLHGDRTWGWLPARGAAKTAFRLAILPVERRVRGVADIRPAANGLNVDFMM